MKTLSIANSNRTLALLCTLPIMLSAGCAATRPYYSDSLFDSSTLVESDRSDMVVYLDWVIRNQRVKQITMITPDNGEQRLYPRDDSSPPTIDWLPLPVLFAASYALNPRRKGMETDLLVHTESDGHTPVTALHELDGSVRIEMGRSLQSLLPPPEHQTTREAIVQRFEVSAVRDGERSWQPLELHALEQALALLSPQERTIISDISFVRDQAAPSRLRGPFSKKLWGQYSSNFGATPERKIQLFDTSPGHDTSHFVGEPDHPYPVTTLCLLHEIGHAIADYARIRMIHVNDEWLAAAKRLLAEWESLRVAGQLTKARDAELDRRFTALKAQDPDVGGRFSAIVEQYKQEQGPVVATYLEARGPEKDPTRYGRSSVAESFAESFALYKADPQALRRIYPDLHTWFASGSHIKALRDTLGEDVVSLKSRSAPPPATQAVRN